MSDGPEFSAEAMDGDHPILELSTLEEDVPPELAGKVTNSIQRRLFASDLVEGFGRIVGVFIEFLGIVFSARGKSNRGEGDR